MKSTITGMKEKIKRAKLEIRDAYIIVLATLTVYLGDALPVLAEPQIGEKVKNGINMIYGQIWKIIVPLYALVILIGCARIFFTNGRKAEGILDWIKRASVAFAAILATAWIIGLIQDLTSGGSYNFK